MIINAMSSLSPSTLSRRCQIEVRMREQCARFLAHFLMACKPHDEVHHAASSSGPRGMRELPHTSHSD